MKIPNKTFLERYVFRRNSFEPFGLLNPQVAEEKEILAQLQDDKEIAPLVHFNTLSPSMVQVWPSDAWAKAAERWMQVKEASRQDRRNAYIAYEIVQHIIPLIKSKMGSVLNEKLIRSIAFGIAENRDNAQAKGLIALYNIPMEDIVTRAEKEIPLEN